MNPGARRAALLVGGLAVLIAIALGPSGWWPAGPSTSADRAVAAAPPTTAPARAEPSAATRPPVTAAAHTATTLENVFLPENANLDDCVSAVPRPGCGSKARGGWRQALTFAIVLAGLAFIVWRVVRSARRRRPAEASR